MQTTTLIGLELLFLTLALTVGLVLWCRYIIDTIHRRNLESLRQIQKGLRDGR